MLESIVSLLPTLIPPSTPAVAIGKVYPPPAVSDPTHFPFAALYFKNLLSTFAVDVSTSSKSLTNTAPPPPRVDSCLCIRVKNKL